MQLVQCCRKSPRRRWLLCSLWPRLGPVRSASPLVWLCGLGLLVALALLAYCRTRGDPSDLHNMKHGLMNVLPEHHRMSETGVDSLLKDVPPTVHFLWCGSSSFQFQHYLSVLSAYKLLQPTEVVFHYESLPQRDPSGYYQYYDDLLRDIPNLFPVPVDDSRACERRNTFQYLTTLLNQHGGVFLGMNVILSDKILPYIRNGISTYHPVSKFDMDGIIVMTPADFKRLPLTTGTSSIPCAVRPSTYRAPHPCVSVQVELFPADIFDLKTDFGQLARHIGYGTSRTLTLESSSDRAPNVVHYVRLGKGPLSFFELLSLLSSLFVQDAAAVYIHCDREPSGRYWDRVKYQPRLTVVQRRFPDTVYSLEVSDPTHASNVLRFDVLCRYGGIYVDWNVIWVKPLSDSQRKYQALAYLDWSVDRSFPGFFNMNIMVAKKGATFTKFMMESFRQVDSKQVFNVNHIAYKVYELHPDSLHVDTHLQATCTSEQCHPPLRSQSKYKSNSVKRFDWRSDTNVVHWFPGIPECFEDREHLMSATGVNADIGRYVLRRAAHATKSLQS